MRDPSPVHISSTERACALHPPGISLASGAVRIDRQWGSAAPACSPTEPFFAPLRTVECGRASTIDRRCVDLPQEAITRMLESESLPRAQVLLPQIQPVVDTGESSRR
ncbi:unnamed protein product [Larinioides sclopetarius]|uniref:Uncharacterized protein n=1 Tax=Larinioides sclopetarius TaxID=280406 RepID=A0AAV2ANZ7_9ARAC